MVVGERERDDIAHDEKKDDGIPFSIAVRFTTATAAVDDDAVLLSREDTRGFSRCWS